MAPEFLNEDFEPEARRVAAAFGVEEWGPFGLADEDTVDDGWHSGIEPLSGVSVTWSIAGGVRRIDVYNRQEERLWASLRLIRGYNRQFGRLDVYSGGHELMARGLYRLGLEDEAVFAELSPLLTAHEKMELRLSMPREFWPQKWLDEENAR